MTFLAEQMINGIVEGVKPKKQEAPVAGKLLGIDPSTVMLVKTPMTTFMFEKIAKVGKWKYHSNGDFSAAPASYKGLKFALIARSSGTYIAVPAKKVAAAEKVASEIRTIDKQMLKGANAAMKAVRPVAKEYGGKVTIGQGQAYVKLSSKEDLSKLASALKKVPGVVKVKSIPSQQAVVAYSELAA